MELWCPRFVDGAIYGSCTSVKNLVSLSGSLNLSRAQESATPGVTGSLQAMEVLKHLAGVRANLRSTLLVVDGEGMSYSPIQVNPRLACTACGHLR